MGNLSSYPSGFRNGVAIQGVPLNWMLSGKAFWVDSTRGRNNNRGTFDRPLGTVQKGIDLATDAGYDYVFVKEGHAETISASGAITFASKSGTKVIGLGTGRSRPTITYDTADTVKILMSSASCMMQNIRFSANFADIAAAIVVSAKGCVVDSCAFVDTAANMNWLAPIKVTSTTINVADSLEVTNNRWRSPDTAGTQLVNSAATLDAMVVSGNVVMHEGTDSALVKFATGKIFTYAEIMWNFLAHKMTANELLVNNDGSTNTGIIAHNRVGHADVTGTHDLGIDALGCRLFDNLSVSVDTLQGFVVPAIDVNL